MILKYIYGQKVWHMTVAKVKHIKSQKQGRVLQLKWSSYHDQIEVRQLVPKETYFVLKDKSFYPIKLIISIPDLGHKPRWWRRQRWTECG